MAESVSLFAIAAAGSGRHTVGHRPWPFLLDILEQSIAGRIVPLDPFVPLLGMHQRQHLHPRMHLQQPNRPHFLHEERRIVLG